MRPLYFIFRFALTISFRLFFRRVEQVRPSNKRFGRTIFVSNHPSAFLDPLVIAGLRKPVVFFMTRSDVFNRFTRPIFWLAHMLPIYRQQDGGNSQEKNKAVFKKATQALARNRNLLLFGEGITDDVFERRLKPIKKGAIRIGFTALEDLNWSVQIEVQGLGINYTDPGVLRSDVLIAAAEPIVLNNYKDAYLENPSKVISELNRELEIRMQGQITHLNAEHHVLLHEQIMMLNRKGMHVSCYDPTISLQDRWDYSRQLALQMNELNESANQQLINFSTDTLSPYLKQLAQIGLSEAELYWFALERNWKVRTIMLTLIQLPFFLFGLIHVAVPHLLVKRFVESKFERKVFWSSSKMGMLLVLLPLWNILVFMALSFLIHEKWYFWLTYFVSLNFVAVAYYLFIKNTTLLRKSVRYNAQSLQTIVAERKRVLEQLGKLQF